MLRGSHRLAEAADRAYDAARASVARFLNAPSADEMVFTSGATAALNLVAHAFGATLRPGDRVLVSQAEHHSNFVPWQMLRERAGIVLDLLPVMASGELDLAALPRLLTPRTRLVAVTQCSNVTGAWTDVAAVVAAARAVGAHVLLDGAQAVQHGPQDVQALGVDFYAFSGHKAFAPNGIGVLWGRGGKGGGGGVLVQVIGGQARAVDRGVAGGGQCQGVGAGETAALPENSVRQPQAVRQQQAVGLGDGEFAEDHAAAPR